MLPSNTVNKPCCWLPPEVENVAKHSIVKLELPISIALSKYAYPLPFLKLTNESENLPVLYPRKPTPVRFLLFPEESVKLLLK